MTAGGCPQSSLVKEKYGELQGKMKHGAGKEGRTGGQGEITEVLWHWSPVPEGLRGRGATWNGQGPT